MTFLITPSWGPRICTGAACAAAAKILPIGAPAKYGSVVPATCAMPPVVDGKLPTCLNSSPAARARSAR